MRCVDSSQAVNDDKLQTIDSGVGAGSYLS
jgi:hypothetical protein